MFPVYSVKCIKLYSIIEKVSDVFILLFDPLAFFGDKNLKRVDIWSFRAKNNFWKIILNAICLIWKIVKSQKRPTLTEFLIVIYNSFKRYPNQNILNFKVICLLKHAKNLEYVICVCTVQYSTV